MANKKLISALLSEKFKKIDNERYESEFSCEVFVRKSKLCDIVLQVHLRDECQVNVELDVTFDGNIESSSINLDSYKDFTVEGIHFLYTSHRREIAAVFNEFEVYKDIILLVDRIRVAMRSSG